MPNDNTPWIRTCQECGHEQSAKKPDTTRELTNSYRNSKCRKCGSEGSLDYGKYSSEDWELEDAN